MAAPILESFASTENTTGSATSLPMTMPSGVVAGNLLVMVVRAFCADSGFAVPSGWTALYNQSQSSPAITGVFWKFATGSDATTVTWTTGAVIGGSVFRISGARGSTPIDVFNVPTRATSSLSVISIDTITTTGPDRLLLGVGMGIFAGSTPRSLTSWDRASSTLLESASGHNIPKSAWSNAPTAGATTSQNFNLSGAMPYRVGIAIAIAPTSTIDGPLAATLTSPTVTVDGDFTASPTADLAAVLTSPVLDASGTSTGLEATLDLALSPLDMTLDGDVSTGIDGTLDTELTPPELDIAGTSDSSVLTAVLDAVLTPVEVDVDGTASAADGPIVLTGVAGTFDIDFATFSYDVEYTPTFDGTLVIQVDDPAGWHVIYTVTDDDGDEVQVDEDTLSLIWTTDELITITLAPDIDEPDPDATVTFSWTYAVRASSVLTMNLEYDYVHETPGGIEVAINNGAPGEVVTFSIGPFTDFQTATLDAFGSLPELIVNLPALPADEYTLQVEGTDSGSIGVLITVQEDALTYDDATVKAVDVPPVVDPAQHWRFYDLRDDEINWTFPRNPASWSNVFPPNDFTHDKTTAVDGQPLTWQAAARPWRMECVGWLNTEEEYNQLVFWSQLRRRFWLIDHRNRAWLMTIEQFDARHQIKMGEPWAHEYTLKTLIFMQGTTD